MSEDSEKPANPQSFFAFWMLMHEKADDWLKGALERARATPEGERRDYQSFLLGVDREKEMLKSIFADALVNELKHAGFVHRAEAEGLKEELDLMRERLKGMEERLERLAGPK